MARKRIGLDVDGVLYNFVHGVQYMWSQRYELPDREDIALDLSRYDLGMPREDWDWACSKPQSDYLYRHAHLYSGAIEFVYDLAELGDVVLLTARPTSASKVTLQWVTYTFDHEDKPFPFSEVHILGDGRAKSEIPCDVYIDDRLDNIFELWQNTKAKLILLDRPWNRDNLLDFPLPYRATSFEEVLERVRSS